MLKESNKPKVACSSSERGRRFLALVWIFRDSPNDWFADFPAVIDIHTVQTLLSLGYVEKNTKGQFRLTPQGRDLGSRLNGFSSKLK